MLVLSLLERRKNVGLTFLFELVDGYIDCPELLSFLNFNVPQCKTSSTTIVYVFSKRTICAIASHIIHKMMQLANETKRCTAHYFSK